MAKKKEKKEKKAGKSMSKKELAALLIDIFGTASHYPSAENVMRRYIT